MEKREALYGRLNKWLLVAFIAINYGMGIWNVVRGDTFHYVLAFASALFVPVVWLFYKLFKLKPVNQLNTIIFAFIFLAYTIGEVLAGYYWIPHFDKVCHAPERAVRSPPARNPRRHRTAAGTARTHCGRVAGAHTQRQRAAA